MAEINVTLCGRSGAPVGLCECDECRERRQRRRSLGAGSRVRLAEDVDRYPHFVAPAGAAGVVTEWGRGLVSVRLDQPLAGAEEWDNEVLWDESHDLFGGGDAREAAIADLAAEGVEPT